MDKKLELHKILVVSTCFVVLLFVGIFFINNTKDLGSRVSINTDNQPTIGNPYAKVHLIIFEDLLCTHCQELTKRCYRRLKEEYIDTGKVRCSIIPLSFIEGSEKLANTALFIYDNYPNLFFSYLEKLGQRSIEDPLICANELGIDEKILKESIANNKYRKHLEENILVAEKIIGYDLAIPAIYINGRYIDSLSYYTLKEELNKELEDNE